MRYISREIRGNVNVSHESPLMELFLLLAGLLGLMVLVYVLLGLAVDLVVPRLPASVDESLGNMFSATFGEGEGTERERVLQALLDDLADRLPEKDRHPYRVTVIPESDSNALALPGWKIVVFSGLLDEVGSENELTFVLGHELGHFANRDHLRGIGRGLVLIAASVVLLGQDNPATEFLFNSVSNVEMKFSQRQELAADEFSLDLLRKKYGHAVGAADLFEKLAEKEKMGRLSYYFATHPHPVDRIAAIKKKAGNEGLQKTPLDKAFKNSP